MDYYREGAKLEGSGAIIPRIGASMTSYGTVLLPQFEMMEVYSRCDRHYTVDIRGV